ncbi:MAG: tyrosine-type recombinase/integrase [Candidatus Eremiobacteraeota bacterium]|nr:tyrosine-type recombinase/integrase [Candidatus Eremiobacteraeota bacterium]
MASLTEGHGSYTTPRDAIRALNFKSTKNGKIKVLSVTDRLLQALKEHRTLQAKDRKYFGKAYKDQDLVFAYIDGTPIIPRAFGSAVRRLTERLKLPTKTLHDLRDTHGSILLKNGVAIEVVSKRLGHSSIQVTMDRYTHIYPERDAAAAEAFEKAMR